MGRKTTRSETRASHRCSRKCQICCLIFWRKRPKRDESASSQRSNVGAARQHASNFSGRDAESFSPEWKWHSGVTGVAGSFPSVGMLITIVWNYRPEGSKSFPTQIAVLKLSTGVCSSGRLICFLKHLKRVWKRRISSRNCSTLGRVWDQGALSWISFLGRRP